MKFRANFGDIFGVDAFSRRMTLPMAVLTFGMKSAWSSIHYIGGRSHSVDEKMGYYVEFSEVFFKMTLRLFWALSSAQKQGRL